MHEQVSKPRTSLPVVVEPEPMPRRARTLGTILASLGMIAVVVAVLYGLSRPDIPPQTAGAPSQAVQLAPATVQGQGQSGEPEKQQPASGRGERSDSATTGAQPSNRPKPSQQ